MVPAHANQHRRGEGRAVRIDRRGMALEPREARLTKPSGEHCLTPGAVYELALSGARISTCVHLPFQLTFAEAAALDTTLHDALEAVLAPLFDARPRPQASAARRGQQTTQGVHEPVEHTDAAHEAL